MGEQNVVSAWCSERNSVLPAQQKGTPTALPERPAPGDGGEERGELLGPQEAAPLQHLRGEGAAEAHDGGACRGGERRNGKDEFLHCFSRGAVASRIHDAEGGTWCVFAAVCSNGAASLRKRTLRQGCRQVRVEDRRAGGVPLRPQLVARARAHARLQQRRPEVNEVHLLRV